MLPDQVFVFAFIEYGLEEADRHHVQGGILAAPLRTPVPQGGPTAPAEASEADGSGETEVAEVEMPDDSPRNTIPTDEEPHDPETSADEVEAEEASPQAQVLEQLLQVQSFLTEQRIQSGFALGIRQHEVTLTDVNLLAIAQAAQDRQLSIETEFLQEAELGANWLWTLPNRKGQELRILAVPKLLDDLTLSYPSLNQRIGDQGPLQVEALIAAAGQRRATPVYVLYNDVINQPVQSGCFFVMAKAMVSLIRNNKTSWRDVQAEASPRPWDELVSLAPPAKT